VTVSADRFGDRGQASEINAAPSLIKSLLQTTTEFILPLYLTLNHVSGGGNVDPINENPMVFGVKRPHVLGLFCREQSPVFRRRPAQLFPLSSASMPTAHLLRSLANARRFRRMRYRICDPAFFTKTCSYRLLPKSATLQSGKPERSNEPRMGGHRPQPASRRINRRRSKKIENYGHLR